MNILTIIEQFINTYGIHPTRFGRNATGDPRLVLDMRMGRVVRPDTEAKIMSYIDEYKHHLINGWNQFE